MVLIVFLLVVELETSRCSIGFPSRVLDESSSASQALAERGVMVHARGCSRPSQIEPGPERNMALGVLKELAHVGSTVVELDPETPDAILEAESTPCLDRDVDPIVALLPRLKVETHE